MKYILRDDSLTVYTQGQAITVPTTHPNYAVILDIIINGGPVDEVISLADTVKAISDYCGDDIQIINERFYYHGEEIHNSLTKKIFRMMDEGWNIQPLLNFFIRLKKNPSITAQTELFDFLEAGDLPITEDGCFLAYKSVRMNYTDIHSGKIDNSVGKVITMPRNNVCADRTITCSTGLHFAQKSYAVSFGGSNSRLMIMKIDPADVVSIPIDYNNKKGRCCKYEVFDEITTYDCIDESAVYRKSKDQEIVPDLTLRPSDYV